MKNKELLPVGIRRDGSYYTRILWADVTENDPTFWVNNLINDDLARNGGTWGANSESTANCVLDFFGETQLVKRIAIYKDVKWDQIAHFEIIKNEGWQEIVLDRPVTAKFIRVELVENFCKKDDSFIPWIETSEIKLYPEEEAQ